MTDWQITKERFIKIYQAYIKRDGADRLLEYLTNEKCDFFTAPASTRFHCAYPGGLAEHSINVFKCLCDFVERKRFAEEYKGNYQSRIKSIYPELRESEMLMFDFSPESLAIVALCHDFCKINFYKTEMRNVKQNNTWVSAPYFTINDEMPFGHGEKSVFMLQNFIRLSVDEAFAIRYHMGFSTEDNPNQVGRAFEMYPLAFALCVADMEASYFIEGETVRKGNFDF